MSIFEAYDAEFTALSDSINKEMANLRTIEEGQDASSILRMEDALLSQSADLIKQMEVEMRSQEGPSRKELASKVNQYKKSLALQKKEFVECQNKINKEKLRDKEYGEVGGDRARLLGANDKLYRQNQIIQNAQRTVFETEEVGAEIVGELDRNRERIQSAQDRAREFGGVADSARRMVNSMQRRETQHKFLMYALMLSILMALCAAVYYAILG
eukprot:GSChrysophyteH1.ASY1.ANO1.848.1 assembled CDS